MYRYFKLNKPFRMLSSFTSEVEGLNTLKDLDFCFPKDVYPVGRLDKDSEGLLLLTNDKFLQHQLLLPENAKQKIYLVQLEGIFDEAAKTSLEKGVIIKHNKKPYQTRPAKIERLQQIPAIEERTPPVRFRKNIPTSWIKVSISEGKNRQVRKMTAKVGFPTLRLLRLQIENIHLDELKSGMVMEMSRTDAYRLSGLHSLKKTIQQKNKKKF